MPRARYFICFSDYYFIVTSPHEATVSLLKFADEKDAKWEGKWNAKATLVVSDVRIFNLSSLTSLWAQWDIALFSLSPNYFQSSDITVFNLATNIFSRLHDVYNQNNFIVIFYSICPWLVQLPLPTLFQIAELCCTGGLGRLIELGERWQPQDGNLLFFLSPLLSLQENWEI